MKKTLLLSIVLVLIGLTSFAQWEWQNPLPQGNTLNSVYFTDNNTGYAVGDGGTILKTTNGGGTVGITKIQQTNNLKIYPNPATNQLTVELSEPGSNMNETVSIFGIAGQELIKQPVQDSKSEINVSSLPKGIYFVKMLFNEKVVTGKFIKN